MNKTERPWGYYQVLFESENTKVKELVVEPGKSLSMQRHKHRNEYWHVVEGDGVLHQDRGFSVTKIHLHKHDDVKIPYEVWHRLENTSNTVLKIIEIQYGSKCIEEDIERK